MARNEVVTLLNKKRRALAKELKTIDSIVTKLSGNGVVKRRAKRKTTAAAATRSEKAGKGKDKGGATDDAQRRADRRAKLLGKDKE